MILNNLDMISLINHGNRFAKTQEFLSNRSKKLLKFTLNQKMQYLVGVWALLNINGVIKIFKFLLD